ncbi:CST complex subunit STN1 [Entomortierella parvispora]|uniref:CST complex subunit STN1 n=1 Tax=Entomortierella parvispora TaxID=205924 RepID=A0A9P3LZN8_9FUNG|nr:CST complex subunit STN1 [Entomortierella parvispora]
MQLLIFQINAMTSFPEHEGIYCHHSRPVPMVETMGVIQRVFRRGTHYSYTLDDGTGTIQCVIWIPEEHRMLYSTNAIKGLEMYNIGQVVRVQGIPGTYLRRMQLTVLPGKISPCHDPNDETVFRLRVLHQERTAYTQESVLPDIIFKEAERATASPATKETLLQTLREWLNLREGKTFSYFDIEGDEGNSSAASALLKQRFPSLHPVHEEAEKMKLITECLLILEDENSIEEIREGEVMTFRVLKGAYRKRRRRRSIDGQEKSEWLHKVIVLDDDDDD